MPWDANLNERRQYTRDEVMALNEVQIRKARCNEITEADAWAFMKARLDALVGEGFGEKVEKCLKERATGRKENYCLDHERACLPGDAPGEAMYAYVRKYGCCGFYDGEATPKKGRPDVKIGYNYGH